MNPLILIGLGAAVLMAMGGKKKNGAAKAGEGEYGPEDETPQQQQQQQQQPPQQQQIKQAFLTKMPPLNHRNTIMMKGANVASECWNSGVKDEMDLTMCIAKKLFPTWDWDSTSGWQQDAWSDMRNVARMKMGKPPLIS